MSSDCKLQINFKSGVPDLINVYADTPEELTYLLAAIEDSAQSIKDAAASLQGGVPTGTAALSAAGVGYTPVPAAPQAPAAPQTGPACQHGPRTWKQGENKAGKPYKGWFCPLPSGGCAPQWG